MATNWTLEMQEQFQKLQRELTQVIVSQAEKTRTLVVETVDERLGAAETRLGELAKVHAEGLREVVGTTAENYGGVLDGIQCELRDFREEWRKKAEDTDAVLANHGARIVVLEGVTGVSRN